MAIASDYAGLWVWLTGDTGFVDQSGNGRTITLPGGGNNPTIGAGVANGHAAFRFSAASQQYFTLPSMAALTAGEVYVVFQKTADPASSSAAAGFWNLGSQDFDSHAPWTDGSIYDGFGSTVRKTVGNPTPSLALPSYYNVQSASGNFTAQLNGSALFTTATNSVGFPTAPMIGRSLVANGRFLDGAIAEIFIYSQIRSAAERAALIATLQATYGSTAWVFPSADRVTAGFLSAGQTIVAPNPADRVTAAFLGVGQTIAAPGAPPINARVTAGFASAGQIIAAPVPVDNDRVTAGWLSVGQVIAVPVPGKPYSYAFIIQ